MIGSPRELENQEKKSSKKQRNEEKNKFSREKKRGTGDCGDAAQTDKASDRDCGRGCSGQKGLLLSTINKNTYSKTQYFVREVKGRRMTKNGVEFLIGWRDFPLDKDDTWEPITNL